ncbi:MAG: hypothetical protein VXW15_08700 [Bdellovibrionota bacterium]|nr:hypothetical protein [Bdellovibrionota bacterium]
MRKLKYTLLAAFLTLSFQKASFGGDTFLWEFALGYHSLSYKENTSSLNLSFKENTGSLKLGLKAMLLPNWLYLTNEVRLMGPVTMTSKKGYEALMGHYESTLRWEIPATPLMFILSAHYFHSRMQIKYKNSDKFGYDDLYGVKYSIEVFFSKLNKHINLFLRYPFQTDLDYRKQQEYSAGAVLFLTPEDKLPYSLPFYFRKGSFIRFTLTSIEDKMSDQNKYRYFYSTFAELGWSW